MKQRYIIGIDVSKSKLDCAVMSSDYKIVHEEIIVNKEKNIKDFLQSMRVLLSAKDEEILICCENTGIYNRPLEKFCVENKIDLWVEHPLKIKRASTDMRGKDDKKDARRIAEYSIRYYDKLVLYKDPSEAIKKVNALSKSRETLIGQKVAIENQLREAKSHDKFLFEVLETSYQSSLENLKKEIKRIEKEIETQIDSEKEIRENRDLLLSIPGIGVQSAIQFIIITDNFKNFDNAKHLACYAGVVPFKNQSGTQIKRERVSKMANQILKKTLHLCSMAGIRSNEELKTYFHRKVSEGKNKMSVLNAVRNKLVHRIMAVIKRRKPYYSTREEFLLAKN